MKATATHNGEELEVTFTADLVSYALDGVVRQFGYDVEDIQIETVKILGVIVDKNALPSELVALITDLADDLDFDID